MACYGSAQDVPLAPLTSALSGARTAWLKAGRRVVADERRRRADTPLAGPGDLQSDRYAAAVPAFRDVVNRLEAFLELQSALPKPAVPGDYMLAQKHLFGGRIIAQLRKSKADGAAISLPPGC